LSAEGDVYLHVAESGAADAERCIDGLDRAIGVSGFKFVPISRDKDRAVPSLINK
jgi:hypothetical protein